MSFTPTNFQDLPSTATPIDAVELNKLGTQHAAAVADSAAQVPGLVDNALSTDAVIRAAADTAVDDAITAEGGITDPTIAAALSDTASQSRGVLDATFAPKLGANLSRSITAMRAGKDQVWAAIGDSKTDPSTPGNSGGSWVERLAVLVGARFGVNIAVTNVAKSGHTAAVQFIGDYITTAVNAAPDLTFVSLGTNDSNSDQNGRYAAGYVKEASIAATERAMAYVRDVNPAAEFVYLATPPYSPITSSSNPKIVTYNNLAEELAAAQGAEFVDGYAIFKAMGDFSSLMYDSTHPGPDGNDLLAQELLKHFPVAGSFGVTPAIATPSPRGLFGIDRVDKGAGRLGYDQVSGVGATGNIALAVEGAGWAVNGSYDESSTPGDSMTLTGDVTEFLVNIDLSLAASPVVDFYLDSVLQDADVDLHAQSGKNSTNYWLAPFTGLVGGEHSMKIVVKSGTLSVQAAIGVIAAPASSAFTPEITYLDLTPLGGAQIVSIDATGAYTKHIDAYSVSLPVGWNSALAQFVGQLQTQAQATTTAERNFNCSLILGSNVLSAAQATHSATTESSNASVRVDSVIPIPEGQTAQGLTLQTRMLSTNKDKARLVNWSLKMILTRTS